MGYDTRTGRGRLKGIEKSEKHLRSTKRGFFGRLFGFGNKWEADDLLEIYDGFVADTNDILTEQGLDVENPYYSVRVDLSGEDRDILSEKEIDSLNQKLESYGVEGRIKKSYEDVQKIYSIEELKALEEEFQGSDLDINIKPVRHSWSWTATPQIRFEVDYFDGNAPNNSSLALVQDGPLNEYEQVGVEADISGASAGIDKEIIEVMEDHFGTRKSFKYTSGTGMN